MMDADIGFLVFHRAGLESQWPASDALNNGTGGLTTGTTQNEMRYGSDRSGEKLGQQDLLFS
jgi:hypothetical protein